ncbi:MAG: S49 family peptidase [Thermofilaceae archaeon]
MKNAHSALLVATLFVLLSIASYLVLREKSGYVGVIHVKGYVLSSESADSVTSAIMKASTNSSIKAVVVVIDSFGGSANYVEQIYLNLKGLRGKKPVVALAVNALSGGYYIAAAADYVFVHPTSFIGSVGVVSTAPPLLVPSEQTLETGAYKHTGFSRLLFYYNLSRALDAFIGAIEEGRGSRLRASREELSKGLVYLGKEAVAIGLADQIGSLEQALSEAARRAGLLSYEVVEVTGRIAQGSGYYTWSNVTASLLEELQPPPALYYIYLGARGLVDSGQPAAQVPVATGTPAQVLVDLSHGNRVSWWNLDALIAELAEINSTVNFVKTWYELETLLNNSTCLIVAAPTLPYMGKEIEKVEHFVKNGGVLILLFDPSIEYVGLEGISAYITAPINTLAERFGLTFAYGFLYNEKEHLGIYRNIYVSEFAEDELFKDVHTITLFTATHIRSGSGIAWTSNSTFSSSAEKVGRYAIIARDRYGKGEIIALGDITIFSEPFCYVEDNYRFIRNLAEFIVKSKEG